MKNHKQEFVKKLIENQLGYVKTSNDEWYNRVACGLFANESFNEVIFDLFGPEFLQATKNEMPSEPRGCVEHHLQMMIDGIEKALK